MRHFDIMGYCQDCEEYRIVQQFGKQLLCEDCIERRKLLYGFIGTTVFWILIFLLILTVAITKGQPNANTNHVHTIQQNIDLYRTNVNSVAELA